MNCPIKSSSCKRIGSLGWARKLHWFDFFASAIEAKNPKKTFSIILFGDKEGYPGMSGYKVLIRLSTAKAVHVRGKGGRIGKSRTIFPVSPPWSTKWGLFFGFTTNWKVSMTP